MHEVQSNPLKGATNLKVKRGMKLGNPKWHDDDGWVKMSRNVKGVEIHFVYNQKTKIFDDFKFK